MSSQKRNTAKPPADQFTVCDDGTVDLRVRGQMVYLRCPAVAELEQVVLGNARLNKELAAIGAELMAHQARVLDWAQRATAAAAEAPSEALQAPPEAQDAPEAPEAAETPEGASVPDGPPLTLPDGREPHELMLAQRRLVAEFWFKEIISPLADPAPDPPLTPETLPYFCTNGDSIARILDGWYGIPPVPGDG